MTYPTIQEVNFAMDAGDFECLRCWHNELPAPRNHQQHRIMNLIERALIKMGKIDSEECTEVLTDLFEGEG